MRAFGLLVDAVRREQRRQEFSHFVKAVLDVDESDVAGVVLGVRRYLVSAADAKVAGLQT